MALVRSSSVVYDRPRVTVHLRVFGVDDDAARAVACLSDAELRRAAAYRAEGARRSYVLRRAWLRDLLAERLDCAPGQVEITLDGRGKPFVVAERVHISCSCRDDVAVVALATIPVGVDVERVPESWSPHAAARVLSERELAIVARAPALERARAFCRQWTRKEAWAKVHGGGLVDELRQVSLDARSRGGIRIDSIEPLPGVVAAVAFDRAGGGRRWRG